MENKQIILLTKEEIAKSNDLALNEAQLNFILQKTPKKFIRSRPAKGGGTWNYVAVGYVTKVLNLMFGWNWNFEIVKEEILIDAREVVVKGRLTVNANGKIIIKENYGNKEIMFRKGTEKPLSIGNDMKAAASDALKKCASMIGVAQDIYAPEEFKEAIVQTEIVNDIALQLSESENVDDVSLIWESLTEKEQGKYRKLFTKLMKNV